MKIHKDRRTKLEFADHAVTGSHQKARVKDGQTMVQNSSRRVDLCQEGERVRVWIDKAFK